MLVNERNMGYCRPSDLLSSVARSAVSENDAVRPTPTARFHVSLESDSKGPTHPSKSVSPTKLKLWTITLGPVAQEGLLLQQLSLAGKTFSLAEWNSFESCLRRSLRLVSCPRMQNNDVTNRRKTSSV
jgi:hypothetical protein